MDILKLKNNFNNKNYNESKNLFNVNKIVKNVKNQHKIKCCPFCSSKKFHQHNHYEILLKNNVFNGKIEYLNIKYHRYKCNECNKTFLENIENRYKNTKITNNLAQQIIKEFKSHQIMSYCAQNFNISNVLVKKIIKEYLIKENSKIKNENVEIISIDEKFMLGKYYTIFRDYNSKNILDIEVGTKSDTVKKFSEFLGQKSRNIKAVSIDKSLSFISGVEKFLPNLLKK